MIIMNAFSEATLRNTFATAELKDVRGLSPNKIAFNFGTEKLISYCFWSTMHVSVVTYNIRIKNEMGNHQAWYWLAVRGM